MSDREREALALGALAEITDPGAVGDALGRAVPAVGVVDLHFACTMAGYRGWHWTVSTSDLDGVEPTVLEVELLPGEGALLAPAWVPWTERLADWRRQHPADPGDDDADDVDDADTEDDEDEDRDDDDQDPDDQDPDDEDQDDDDLEEGDLGAEADDLLEGADVEPDEDDLTGSR